MTISKSEPKIKIAIDAGHNTVGDVGASGNGLSEDKLTLATQAKLIELLDNMGFDAFSVNPSRSVSEVNDSLRFRADSANRSAADLYISLHHNAFSNADAKGVEVFYFRGNSEGMQLAAMISKELSELLKTTNRGAKIGNFLVLRRTNCTSVLIETGFLTNKEDAKSIDDIGVDKIAEIIAGCVKKLYD